MQCLLMNKRSKVDIYYLFKKNKTEKKVFQLVLPNSDDPLYCHVFGPAFQTFVRNLRKFSVLVLVLKTRGGYSENFLSQMYIIFVSS